ncbi:MAG: glycosyltransferase family 2 protein [Marinilabiliaceae bacterium]|nr:glycosyltransferase family 2 protein [Marinilabiliaceae bacterium]
MTPINKPTISVLVTVYNRARYLYDCIQSILKSTFQDYEIIILDDASTDNSFVIATELAKSDTRIALYQNEVNLGQFANRNKAAKLAKGKYLKYVDSDDLIYPHCLEVMAAAAITYPDAGLIAECYFNSNQQPLPVAFSPEEAIITHFFSGNRMLNVGPTSILYKKEIFDKVNGFRQDIGILADVLLNYEVGMQQPIVGVSKDLIFWRIHNEQVTIGQKNISRMMIERFQINQIILNHKDLPVSEKIRSIIKKNITSILARNILKLLMKCKIGIVLTVYKNTNLKLTDILLSFIPNKKEMHIRKLEQ